MMEDIDEIQLPWFRRKRYWFLIVFAIYVCAYAAERRYHYFVIKPLAIQRFVDYFELQNFAGYLDKPRFFEYAIFGFGQIEPTGCKNCFSDNVEKNVKNIIFSYWNNDGEFESRLIAGRCAKKSPTCTQIGDIFYETSVLSEEERDAIVATGRISENCAKELLGRGWSYKYRLCKYERFLMDKLQVEIFSVELEEPHLAFYYRMFGPSIYDHNTAYLEVHLVTARCVVNGLSADKFKNITKECNNDEL